MTNISNLIVNLQKIKIHTKQTVFQCTMKVSNAFRTETMKFLNILALSMLNENTNNMILFVNSRMNNKLCDTIAQ